METLPILAIACIAVVIGMLMVFESGKDPEKYGKIGLDGSGEQDMANDEEEMGIKMPDIDRKSMVDADIEAVKQNVIMGISCTKHPGEDAWDPTITAARLFEKAEKALLRDADAYFAQRAAQEALSLLKANERQIEQLHTLLEQEGSEDDR